MPKTGPGIASPACFTTSSPTVCSANNQAKPRKALIELTAFGKGAGAESVELVIIFILTQNLLCKPQYFLGKPYANHPRRTLRRPHARAKNSFGQSSDASRS
jgi:hypothetical protein